MDVTAVLLAANTAGSTRKEAEAIIENAKLADFGGFMRLLAAELKDGSKPLGSRQMAGTRRRRGGGAAAARRRRGRWRSAFCVSCAPPRVAARARARGGRCAGCAVAADGAARLAPRARLTDAPPPGLLMKGALTSNDEMLLEEREGAWKALPEPVRNEVKASLVDALSCGEPVARHTAAQAIARIGGIEVPAGEWPLLIHGLLNLWGAESLGLKHTSLEALGYLCEELGPDDVNAETTNMILTAIIAGLGTELPVEIRHVAAVALNNALVFARHNMDEEAERTVIMDAIATTTQCPSEEVRVAAFECITQVAFLYYDILAPYLEGLKSVTFDAVRKGEEKVALLGLEFWCTVAEEERGRLDRIEEAKVRRVAAAARGSPCTCACGGVLALLAAVAESDGAWCC